MAIYPKFRAAAASEITVQIKNIDNALPDIFHGNCPKDSDAMIEALEVIINHCKANVDKFSKATKQIMDANGGSHFVCGVKVSNGFNEIDGAPSKAMWRLISKIFESKYTDNDYKSINGIGKSNPPKLALDIEMSLLYHHFEGGWIDSKLKQGVTA